MLLVGGWGGHHSNLVFPTCCQKIESRLLGSFNTNLSHGRWRESTVFQPIHHFIWSHRSGTFHFHPTLYIACMHAMKVETYPKSIKKSGRFFFSCSFKWFFQVVDDVATQYMVCFFMSSKYPLTRVNTTFYYQIYMWQE